MHKLKTKSGAKKRMRVMKSGRVKFAKAHARHLFTFGKTKSARKRNRRTGFLRAMDAKKVKKELFPYGAK
jgi:large subunit ribosomal protein L35